MSSDLWIFGYGSLIWRPAFAHAERRPGFIQGYVRRFWQASPDHRGTPEAPGRVATLLAQPGATCWGVAYRVSAAERGAVLADLDHRERAGYVRIVTPVYLEPLRTTIDALMYIATDENPNYLGPTPVDELARVVRSAHGPSGSNREYVLRLAEALADIGAGDPHVSELASLLAD